MKLERLESRVTALLAAIPAPLSIGKFRAKWANMDKLDKALYIGMAECPALFGADPNDNSIKVISDFLLELEYEKEQFDLETIVAEMERE